MPGWSTLHTSRLDPYNAVWSLGEAAFVELLARDRDRAAEVVSALRATRSHAPVGRLSLQVAEAGIAALDGHAAAARSGLLDAYAGHGAIGASRRQALTGLVMATLLDPGDAQVRAAITESRQLFEKMGAGLWLARLDAAEAGGAAATPSSPALARAGARPGERPPVPADRG